MAEVMAATAVQKATAINVHVYRNGDPYFGPKKCVVNPRKVDFDSFLNEVTRLVRLSGGAVRKIYTPTQGHRIHEVSDLVNNQYYVAGGQERFKRDQYAAGGARMQRPRQRGQRQIRPVAHNNRLQVSARCRKTQEGPKIIHVYRNRDDKSSPVKLLLDKRNRGNMETVCDYVNLKVNLISGQAVQRLYHLNGNQIVDESEIEMGGQYVAAARERFAKVGYGNTDIASPRGKARTFVFGRVPSNTTYGLRPVIQLPQVRAAAAVKSSPRPPMATRKPPPGRAKPTPKPPARRPLVQKRRPPPEKAATPKKEAEGFIPMKPTMVKRSREKEDKSSLEDRRSSIEDKSSLDYSDDPNSVFKAKDKRDEVEGANEVQDSNDTKTELPIDQVAAEEVEEEDIKEDVAANDENKPPKTPEVEDEEIVESKEQKEEESVINQNNNHQLVSSPESHLETSDPPPVIEDEDIEPSSPSATPDPKSPSPSPIHSPVPSPPQDRPNSSQSPAFVTDTAKSPTPQQDSIESPPPNLELPKSFSIESANTPSLKAASPKPQSPQQAKSPSPEPLQPKPPSPKDTTSPDEAQKAETPSPLQAQSPSPKHSSSERGSTSSSVRSMSAPVENKQDTNDEADKSNSIDNMPESDKEQVQEDIPTEDEQDALDDIPKEEKEDSPVPTEEKQDDNQAQSPVNDHTTNPEESNNQESNQESNEEPNDVEKPSDDISPEDKSRTPSPPKTPRNSLARTRAVTSRESPIPTTKEQIGNGHAHTGNGHAQTGNGHAHTEEVNA